MGAWTPSWGMRGVSKHDPLVCCALSELCAFSVCGVYALCVECVVCVVLCSACVVLCSVCCVLCVGGACCVLCVVRCVCVCVVVCVWCVSAL